ncbi:hypothetical protein H4219_000867 [Mycoemilia scoparia]|uniref:DUF3824 domain-containing protein n=1 Tax=Mycoemilia scoparia TaxID=417184 RepID=A0A9W8A280_9FUNG|nr:hypothetical protein H4219_000867 [Mycoemilia scoparia]
MSYNNNPYDYNDNKQAPYPGYPPQQQQPWQSPPPHPNASGAQSPMGFNIPQQAPSQNNSFYEQQHQQHQQPNAYQQEQHQQPPFYGDQGYQQQPGGPYPDEEGGERGVKDFFLKKQEVQHMGPDGIMSSTEESKLDWKKVAVGGIAAAGIAFGAKKFMDHRKEKKLEKEEEEYMNQNNHSFYQSNTNASQYYNGSGHGSKPGLNNPYGY